MRKLILFFFLVAMSASTFAQFQRRGGINRNRSAVPQTNTTPTESQIEAMKKKAEDRKQEFIATFITTLEADDFQKEIISQSLNDYFIKITEFSKVPFDRSMEREDAFKKIREDHFYEISELISENDMKKIDDMLDGKFKEKEAKKKKRKKRRKNKG